jgi:hypothetical protein
MFALASAILDLPIASIVELDDTKFSTGDVIATYCKDFDRMAWRIVAGDLVGEYGLQYEFSRSKDQWRWFTGNDDMSHRRYFTGIKNAKAACKRHYERNN